jgi:hypothetical protein
MDVETNLYYYPVNATQQAYWASTRPAPRWWPPRSRRASGPATTIKVWYDEYEIKLGDSISGKIDEGLVQSRFGVAVLSRPYFAKNWPKKELEALLDREARESRKIILPVWHDVDRTEVAQHSALLAGRRAALTKDGIQAVVDQILDVLGAKSSGP